MKGVAAALAAALSLLPVGSFGLDAPASRVEFTVADNRGGFTGVAGAVEAQATVREQGDTFAAEVEARIDARRLSTGLGVRDAQMRRTVLRTDRYPFITFRGTAVPRDRPGGLPFAAVLRGRLTITDVTRDVEIPLRVIALADAYLAEGEVALRLSEFGLPIPRFFIFAAEDRVLVRFAVRLTRR